MTEPFEVPLGDADIADLRARLARTRWPEPATAEGWAQGVPLEYVQELCRYWAQEYDFGFARRINAFPQFRTTVDGLGIHHLHVRSPEPDALPLVLTHGWPGSVVEFLDVLGPLTDPRAHGGDPADAFHVVAPSLPGYGWSDKPTETGWNAKRIARAWDTLMGELGYERYAAQGGDWGALITNSLAQVAPERLVGVHVNSASVASGKEAFPDETPFERKAAEDIQEHVKNGMGYSTQQATRPQTLGYGLTDSPSGQAAWITEKFWAWTDHRGTLENALTQQQMLDAISVYWFTASAASSARMYWENREQNVDDVMVPSGISIFPGEFTRPSRRQAERQYTDLRWYEELPVGGHFAAFEQPESFVQQVRGFFKLLR